MKNLERDRRRKKGAIGSQDGSFRTFKRRTGQADGRSATCILEEGWKRSGVLYAVHLFYFCEDLSLNLKPEGSIKKFVYFAESELLKVI